MDQSVHLGTSAQAGTVRISLSGEFDLAATDGLRAAISGAVDAEPSPLAVIVAGPRDVYRLHDHQRSGVRAEDRRGQGREAYRDERARNG